MRVLGAHRSQNGSVRTVPGVSGMNGHAFKLAAETASGRRPGRPLVALITLTFLFERFTESGQRVLLQAREEARQLRHSFVGTEHILLALLHEKEGIAAQVLDSLSIKADDVRSRVSRVLAADITNPIRFTPRAKKVVELSMQEALARRQWRAETEHILLALARDSDGIAARILRDFGVDGKKIRSETLARLSGP